MSESAFDTILVANRGEIAVRVMRSARALGYRTVAVYSDADADALHTRVADVAVHIGASPVGASYLCIDKLIEAARKSGAGAIHPGYGFLSENAAFASACLDAGITFIGPPASAISLMGNKRAAKLAMIEAEVPCVPGYEGDDQELESLAARAREIGFPVMVKAAAGGGGRGMRLVRDNDDLEAEIRSARSEAEHGFGSGELLLEKAIERPRHVEIQVFADQQGHCVYLGERDCSVQRRHQKVIEEAPSPAVTPALRKQMGEAAVRAAQACDYVGAGTVEFLLAEDGSFYFLEMNTRLQVEHPVTELITGTDLVAWQIQVAAGHALPRTQDEIALTGHAIEVRLYAEDPGQGFVPQTGKVLRWYPDDADGVRIDGGIHEGQNVSPFYDPILAKVIAWGADREQARRRLLRALERSVLLGVPSNNWFLRELLDHPTFAAGEATTAMIGTEFAGAASLRDYEPTAVELGIAGWLMARSFGQRSLPESLRPRTALNMQLEHGASSTGISLQLRETGTLLLAVGEEQHTLQIAEIKPGLLSVLSDGVRRTVCYAFDQETLWLQTGNGGLAFRNQTWAVASSQDEHGNGQIRAPMDGALIALSVAVGDAVGRGQTLATLEAMKMEHALKADIDGIIESISASEGDQVRGKQVIVTIGTQPAD